MRGTLGATVLAQGSIIAVLLGIPFLLLVLNAILYSSDATRDLTRTTAFVYLMGALVCAHPFIALGYSEVLIKQGENPFYFTVPINQGVLAPQPWLAYTVIALLFTALFFWLSVRLLRPTQDGGRAGKAPRAPAAIPKEQGG
jgi:hypothetical protein